MAARSYWSDKAKAIYVSASAKAGQSNIQSEAIARIQLEAAADSSFTQHQLKLNAAVDKSIARLKSKQARLDAAQRRVGRQLFEKRRAELEAARGLDRVCVVLDFDMFYAAVAIRDNPELAEKPLAVGGALVLTSNYIARQWGVRSAMPGFVAKELCRRGPEFGMPAVRLTFVRPDYDKYAEVARQAMEVYEEYDSCPTMGMGFDEVSLDITSYLKRRLRLGTHELANVRGDAAERHRRGQRGDGAQEPRYCDAEEEAMVEEEVLQGWQSSPPDEAGGVGVGYLARSVEAERRALQSLAGVVVEEIRARVQQVTSGLTVSAGIAPNFLLAKIAADVRKPNGQHQVDSSVAAILSFLRSLPTRKVPGIGRVCERKLAEVLCVRTCGELLGRGAEVICLFSRVRAESLLRAALGWCEHAHDWAGQHGSAGAGESSGGGECWGGASDVSASGGDAGGGVGERRGISNSDTFQPSDDPSVLRRMLRVMCEGLAERMSRRQLRGTTLSLRLKDAEFDVRSRTGQAGRLIGAADELYARAAPMLERELTLGGGTEGGGFRPLKLRSIGVQMTHLSIEGARLGHGLRRLPEIWGGDGGGAGGAARVGDDELAAAAEEEEFDDAAAEEAAEEAEEAAAEAAAQAAAAAAAETEVATCRGGWATSGGADEAWSSQWPIEVWDEWDDESPDDVVSDDDVQQECAGMESEVCVGGAADDRPLKRQKQTHSFVGHEQEADVATLTEMGFAAGMAAAALQQHKSDCTAAVEWLLGRG